MKEGVGNCLTVANRLSDGDEVGQRYARDRACWRWVAEPARAVKVGRVLLVTIWGLVGYALRF